MVRPPTLGSVPYTPSVRMAPFTIILKTLAKENKYEPNHLELYFYDDDPDLDYRLSKCREKTEQKDREVIRMLVNIFNSGVNPYSDQLRTMGEVEGFSDYHIEFNLDQRLD
jgi:hypothetical protein